MFAVHAAGSFGEAVTLLATDVAFVAVVTDFDLGAGGDGEELLQYAQERLPGCARILVTGTPRARGDKTIGSAAETVFEKPWRTGTIRDHLHRRLAG